MATSASASTFDNNIVTNMVSSESASASKSVIYAGRPYDVFLSFRGPDTRYGFSDFLYHALLDADIKTFRDFEELREGYKLGPEIIKAIEESKIAIPVLSKRYAESKWCLRELAKIAECRKKRGQMVIPIFYHVDPSKVKDYDSENWCYKDSFNDHEKNVDVPKADVDLWRDAFAMFKGFDKPSGAPQLMEGANPYEAEVVKEVVKSISSELDKKKAYLPDILVGMDSHIRKLEELLDSTDSKYVRVIAIVGMSGIGKTTIAAEIYNKLKYHFDSHHCFLEDVGGNSQHDIGLMRLQQQLVSKIRNREKPNIEDVHKGAKKIEEVIGEEKVLIVLDNVNSKSQIKMLLTGGRDSLKSICDPGSLFIITTIDENIVPKSEVTCTYKPELMGHSDARRLFCRHAFKKEYPPNKFESLTDQVVSSAGGLPLALVVLGSLLSNEKDTALWEATFNKLKAIPRTEVLERLRIGYDALDIEQKQIFLDIACFFVGAYKDYPVYMWEDCGLHPSEGIEALVRKSFITVGEGDNIIRMHAQLIQLGRKIVKEKTAEPYVKVPGKRSRLWDQHEALETLTKYKGAEKVEALDLSLMKFTEDQYEQHVLVREDYVRSEFELKSGGQEKHYIRLLREKDFSHLPNLRFLRLGYVSLYGDFRRLFSNLRWLEWKCCQKIILINFYPKNLVILDLSNSTITDEWERWTSFKVAKKLKVLNLSGCRSLRRAPDFFTTLEMLNLRMTRLELEQINPWVSKLAALRALDISYCDIKNLDCSTLENLEILNATHCVQLRTLGDFSNLRKLKKMLLSSCKKLTEIGGLRDLVSLEYLDLSSCHSIISLPVLSNSRMLKKLSLYGCKNLSVIEGLGGLESLEVLDMHVCRSISRFPDLRNARMLKELILTNCKSSPQVDDLGGLESLEHLDLVECISMVRLPNLPNPSKLKKLYLRNCVELREIKGFSDFVSLEEVDLSFCTALENNLDFSHLKSLKTLKASGLYWTEIRGLEELISNSLESLIISGLEKLPDFSTGLRNRRGVNIVRTLIVDSGQRKWI